MPDRTDYRDLQHEHDQHPLWPHGGRVPGTRRPHSRQAREARAILEALLQKQVQQ